jgi:hypothetical protein
MTFDWLEGPEVVAFQVTGACPDGHAHFELLGIDGASVAEGTITRRQCVALGHLFASTAELIDETTKGYVAHGIAEAESLLHLHS